MASPTAREAYDRKQVVALSWRRYLDWLAEHWEAGQHIAAIGTTGEGKTTAAIGMLQLRKWVLALDPKGEDDTLSASGYERLTSWPPPARIRNAIAEGYPARLIIGGPARTEAETRQLEATLQAAVDGAVSEGGWTLYIDEFQVLSDRRMMGVTAGIERALITARTRKTSVMVSYQAPAWVPRAATRQASLCLIWGTHDTDSVKTIAESFGRPWKDLLELIRELPQYHFLAIPKQHRDPMILTHPPAIN